ncbi:hypothetical protein LTR08_007546 [Meristemomyces frigidus]|nr:hypothetical protein LTR08_007546 [Meristemomyces frigidus]
MYTPSLLYSLLPVTVQRRIPRLRSLRRKASTYATPTHSRTASNASDASDASLTPPPSYHVSERSSVCDADDDECLQLPQNQPMSLDSVTEAQGERTSSGVRWKYAHQGHTLLSLSTQEADAPSHHPQFSRKLYIDSIEYLLHGLPTEMTAQEEASLRCALPSSLLTAPSTEDQLAVQRTRDIERFDQPAPAPDPSVLHRAVAQVTLYAILLVYMILPYVQLLLQRMYQYDRKHKVSDRLLAQGALTADMLGKQTLLLANNLCAMNDGKVGEAVRGAGVWWVQGVSGGVYDGLGEGMQVLGLRPAMNGQAVFQP